MARPKGESTLRKHFKLTEETAKLLAERSKVKNNNSHIYSNSDKIELKLQLEIIKDLLMGIGSI